MKNNFFLEKPDGKEVVLRRRRRWRHRSIGTGRRLNLEGCGYEIMYSCCEYGNELRVFLRSVNILNS